MPMSNWSCKQIKNDLLTGLIFFGHEWSNLIQTYKIIMVNTKNKLCRIIIVNTIKKNSLDIFLVYFHKKNHQREKWPKEFKKINKYTLIPLVLT